MHGPLNVKMVCTVNLHILTFPVFWPMYTETPHYTALHTSTGLSYALNFQAGVTSQIPSCASRILKESPARAKDEEYFFSNTLCNHHLYLRIVFFFHAPLSARHQRVEVTGSCLMRSSVICIAHQMLFRYHIKVNKIGRACCTYWGGDKYVQDYGAGFWMKETNWKT
jgi:hypothetical protein